MFKIVSKQKLAPKEFDIWVEAPRIANHAKAGQFVVLRVDDSGERIPLTIADYDSEAGLVAGVQLVEEKEKIFQILPV